MGSWRTPSTAARAPSGRGLRRRGQHYAVMVPKTNAVPLGGRKKKIERLLERLPEKAFSEVLPARDTGGRRPWEWACLALAADPKRGMRRWLLSAGAPTTPKNRASTRPTARKGRPWRTRRGVP